MGNRAVITNEAKQIGVYVHWNGGRLSIEGFLAYCRLKEYRNPNNDCYGWARLCQVIGNFFGGECSVGIDKYERLDTDNGDNGVYVIGKNWEIVDRLHADWGDDEVDPEKLEEFIIYLDEQMPKKEQLGADKIKTELAEYKNKLKIKNRIGIK